ncbi:MAG: hypothetical protein ACKO57_02540, partial [Alphaproteobacteria bacterium]
MTTKQKASQNHNPQNTTAKIGKGQNGVCHGTGLPLDLFLSKCDIGHIFYLKTFLTICQNFF